MLSANQTQGSSNWANSQNMLSEAFRTLNIASSQFDEYRELGAVRLISKLIVITQLSVAANAKIRPIMTNYVRRTFFRFRPRITRIMFPKQMFAEFFTPPNCVREANAGSPIHLNLRGCATEWRTRFAGSRGERISRVAGRTHSCISALVLVAVKTSHSHSSGAV